MRKSWLLCVLLGSLAWGQAPPAAHPLQQPPTEATASVPPNAPVITITGFCPAQPKPAAAKGTAAKPAPKSSESKTSSDCKTIITRAQFERIANNLAPNITPQQKKQLAGILPRLMVMSAQAKKEGLDKKPQYEERVKFNKMQILSQELQQNIQEEAAKVPDAEIEKYYKEHADSFEQFTVDRIFVPRTKQEAEPKEENDKDEKLTEEQQKEKQAAEKAKQEQGEQAMSKLAEDLRARAAAGEDFVKLQKEAFEAAGMKIESPTVSLPNVRRSGLPAAHASVFDLKPGEVSQVINDSGGHYIYKVVSKTEMTIDQARNEIHGKLQGDRMREKLDKLNNSFKAEENQAYFGPANMMPARPRPGMPMPPPASQQPPPPAKQN